MARPPEQGSELHPSTPAPPTSSIQGLESDMVISLCRALYRGILLLRHVPYRLRRVARLLHYPTRHMCPSEGDIQGFQARGVGDDLSPTHGQRRWRLRAGDHTGFGIWRMLVGYYTTVVGSIRFQCFRELRIVVDCHVTSWWRRYRREHGQNGWVFSWTSSAQRCDKCLIEYSQEGTIVTFNAMCVHFASMLSSSGR